MSPEKAMKTLQEMENLFYKDRLRLQYLNRAYKRAGEGLFTGAWSDGRRNNGVKLEESRFRSDTGKN